MTRSPNQLVNTPSANAKYEGEVAADKNHQTTNKDEINKALPVMRVKIDVIDVSCGR
jgi:hypothetical protein